MFMYDVDASQVPLKKYYMQREKVVKRQSGGVVLPEDDEEDVKPKNTKPKTNKEKKKATVDGDEDLVEDFELSDEEMV
jgi:DeoR/GlpR family transcriptional regulator of sugar metabolism